jgi:hypothetical protein
MWSVRLQNGINSYFRLFNSSQTHGPWCNAIGYAGITIPLAFFNDQPTLHDSDEEHIGFATYYLENLRFLYRDLERDDKKVCEPNFVCDFNIVIYLLEMEGALLQPLHPPDLCSPSCGH